MATYAQKKAEVRAEAMDYQRDTATKPMSWGETAKWCDHFEKLGKRYGLLKEFRENGII